MSDDIAPLPFPPEPPNNPGEPPPPPPQDAELASPVEPAEVIFPPPKPSPGIWGTILWVIVYVGAQFLAGAAFAAFVAIWKVMEQGPEGLNNLQGDLQALLGPLVMVLLVSTFVTGVGIPILLYRGQVWRRLAVRGVHPLHLLLAFGMILPILCALDPLTEWVRQIRGAGPPELPPEYQILSELPWYWVLVMACLLPGVGEESFFRGFLGRGLVGRYWIVPGMVLTSVLFGLGHIDSLEHIIATTFLGFALHTVYLLTKTLAAPVLMHMGNNALAFGVLILAQANDERNLKALAETEKLPPVVSILAAVALLCLVVLFYQTRTRWVLPNGEDWSPGYLTAEMPPASLEARLDRHRASWGAVLAAVLSWAAFAGSLVWLSFKA